MKTSKSLPKIDQNLSTIFHPIASQLIGKAKGEDLVKEGNHLKFRDKLVCPEFVSLAKIPFHIFTTIRDPYWEDDLKNLESGLVYPSFSKKKNTKQREDYCKNLAANLNASIVEKYPDIASASKSARFVRVEEFGQSDEVHVHLLWHLDERAEHLAAEVLDYLENLEPKSFRGVKCFDNKLIYDRLGIVSYVCKIEKGREFKKFGYSPRFRPDSCRMINKGRWQ